MARFAGFSTTPFRGVFSYSSTWDRWLLSEQSGHRNGVASMSILIHPRNVEKTILNQGIEPSGVQYLRLSNMQFLQNVSTSAASAGVLTQPRPIADISLSALLRCMALAERSRFAANSRACRL